MNTLATPHRRISAAIVLAVAAYFAGACAIVIGLSQWRTSSIAALSTPAEQARWQQWKAEAAKQDGSIGPVSRRPPKSDEPPTLVLFRDHFGVLITAALTFYSFLFALCIFLARGMLRGASFDASGSA